MLGQIQTGY